MKRSFESQPCLEPRSLSTRSAGARHSLLDSSALYQAVFTAATDGMAIIDVDGFYLKQNEAHRALIGYSDAELQGQTPAIHLGAETFAGIGAALAKTGYFRGEVISYTKHGPLAIELSAAAVKDRNGDTVGYIGIKRDISRLRAAEAELRERLDHMETLYELSAAVARSESMEDVYSASLHCVTRALKADRAAVLVYDTDNVMRFKAWRDLSEAYRAAVTGHSPWTRDAKDPQPVTIADVNTAEGLHDLRQIVLQEGIQAMAFIPLVYQGHLLGKFMTYYASPHLFTATELQLAQTVASTIAASIGRKEAEQARQRSEERYRFLSEATKVLVSSLEAPTMLRKFAELAVPTLGDACFFDVLDDAGNARRIAWAHRDPEQQRRYAEVVSHVPRDDAPQHPVNVVLSTGKPVLASNIDEAWLKRVALSPAHLEFMRASGTCSLIGLPLIANDRVRGVLTFTFSTSRRQHTRADLELGEELARRAAIALQHAALFEESQARLAALQTEIGERMRSEAALRESEARFRHLADSMPQVVWSSRADGYTDYLNRRGIDWFGPNGENGVSDGWLRALHPDDAERVDKAWTLAIASGDPYESEFRLRDARTGAYRWQLARAVPVRDDAGAVVRWFGTCTDIDEQKRTDEKIRFQAHLLDVVAQSVIATDTQGRVIYWNKFAETLFGWRADEAMGRDIIELTSPQMREKAAEILALLQQGKTWNGEFPLQRRDGSVFPASVQDSPVYSDDGTLIGIIGVAFDLTEQKRMEEEVIKGQKLESIGVLAGGIAHDFNNILTGIVGNVALAKLFTKPGDKIDECLREAERAFARARDLTQQLLTFSKGGAPIKKTASIVDVIEDTVGFVLRGTNIRYHVEAVADLRAALFDPGQISQVVNNLVINARQAMADGGVLHIRADNCLLREREVGALPAGEYIRVRIRDEGIGIPPAHLAKIFDPYFTTKQSGSGLGLATTYSIVKRHEGHIDVESTVGVGTTFSVYLPASRETLPAPRSVAAPAVRGDGRVLFMDDEPSIRRVGGELLKSLGYHVDFAQDGSEALQCYRTALDAAQPYAAVILDLTVPGGMGGLDCLKQLRRLDPNVKAIVSSGYSNDPIMANYSEHGFCGVVAKPYHIKDLSDTVYRVVAGPGA